VTHPAWRRLAVLLAVAVLSGCRRDPCDVVIYTYVDQIFSHPPLKTFEAQTGLKVCATFPSFETKGSGVVRRLLEHADAPQVDVFWADDPVRPFLLMQRGLIEPYRSPQAEGVPAAFKDAGGLWAGVGGQARVLLVNTKLLPRNKEPTSIRSLIDPRWKGRAAIPNPLHGSTMAQMAVLDGLWGDEEMRRFIDALRANQVRIATTSWDVKRLVEKGDVAFGLTNTDHASEALASGGPVAVVYPDQEKNGIGTLVLPTSVLLIRGGPHPEAARRLVDHLLSPGVEAELCRSGSYFPLRAGATALPGLRRIEDIHTMPIDFLRAGEGLERIKPWLESWVGH
jgi:iron(III) transport system substrate-binding protein